ncbi:DUF4439 domain-containing protein [Naumannella halotolerans]|uniref:DUF4439 domain-containing protein n=1 Tax=Naumannella halotolerans TaxID=993414 RepID=UPI00370D8DF5
MPASNRRQFLVIGATVFTGIAGGLAWNAARGDSPALSGGRPPAPTPAPSSTATSAIVEARSRMTGLLALAEAAGADPALLGAHRAHLTALVSGSPGTRPSTSPGSPLPTPGSAIDVGDDPARELIDAERSAAEALVETTPGATGTDALVCGSLAAFCTAAAEVVEDGGEIGAPGTGALSTTDDVTAMQQVVAQCHAAVFAYQRLLGLVQRSDDGPILAALERYRSLRDELSGELVDRGAAAPAAEAGYLVPDEPQETDRVIESGLLPYLGQWLQATNTESDRDRAATMLSESTLRAVRAGATLPAWPGWPDPA